jgi:hypothetical protein
MTTETVHPMVMKAAREIGKDKAAAEHYKFDSIFWEHKKGQCVREATRILTECGALDCLAALEASHDPENYTEGTAERMAHCAIAKVYGSAP